MFRWLCHLVQRAEDVSPMPVGEVMFQVRQCAEQPGNPTAVSESHLPRFGLVPVPQFQELCSDYHRPDQSSYYDGTDGFEIPLWVTRVPGLTILT
jgi:hypothetical protein